MKFRRPFGRLLAALTSLTLMAGGAPVVVAQSAASTAVIKGVVKDPAGVASKGFRVVFRDIANNTRYSSTATDALGQYLVELPLGGRYQIENVIADDAVTRLPVEDTPPISVLTTDPLTMDVHFSGGRTPAATSGGGKAGKSPWYKRPGPIVGMVLVGAGIAAVALDNGSSEASSFLSPPPADR